MAGSSAGMAVRTVFGLISLGVGIYGGWLAHDRTGSVWLAVFVGIMALNYIGRGIADVITDPQKMRRFGYFTLPVIFAVGSLAGVYALWDRWWLAVIVGFVFFSLGTAVATAIFPRIAAEEAADSMNRMMGGQQVSLPDEDVNPLPLPPSPYDDVKRY